jgi:DNA-binding NarL/FixJ family response regulator
MTGLESDASRSGRGQGNRVRVAVVDLDDGRARTALIRDGHLDVIALPSLAEAGRFVRDSKPGVLVAAFDEPREADVRELRSIHQRNAGLKTIVISRPIAEARVTELLKAGAGGFLFSSDTPILPNAVRELVRGGIPMSAPVSRLVLDRARRSSAKMAAVNLNAPATDALLTRRQREILELLAKGLSYADVGSALGLSLNTIRTHVRTLYERLGATTKVEAVMIGIEIGLLNSKPPFR